MTHTEAILLAETHRALVESAGYGIRAERGTIVFTDEDGDDYKPLDDALQVGGFIHSIELELEGLI